MFKSGDEDSEGSGVSVEDYPSQEVALRVQLQRAIEEERSAFSTLKTASVFQIAGLSLRTRRGGAMTLSPNTFCRYDEAALLRDNLQHLQRRYQEAAAKSGASLVDSSEQRRFCIGQRVQHTEQGYRAVVYGCGPFLVLFWIAVLTKHLSLCFARMQGRHPMFPQVGQRVL